MYYLLFNYILSHLMSYSCNKIGISYDTGEGVRQDYTKASEYYQKACDGGNFSVDTSSHFLWLEFYQSNY